MSRAASIDRPTYIAAASALLVMAVLAMAWIAPAYAMTLDEAKAQGLIGETHTGYVGYPTGPSAAVEQLGAGVNLARKASYTEIAGQQGVTLRVVEELAGRKLVENAPAGQYVNDGSGWKRK